MDKIIHVLLVFILILSSWLLFAGNITYAIYVQDWKYLAAGFFWGVNTLFIWVGHFR
jgi:hypothetical protein